MKTYKVRPNVSILVNLLKTLPKTKKLCNGQSVRLASDQRWK